MAKACPKCGTNLKRAEDGVTIICPGCGAKFAAKKKESSPGTVQGRSGPEERSVGSTFRQHTETRTSFPMSAEEPEEKYSGMVPKERPLQAYDEGDEESVMMQSPYEDDEEELLVKPKAPAQKKSQQKPQNAQKPIQKSVHPQQKGKPSGQKPKQAPGNAGGQKKPQQIQKNSHKPGTPARSYDDSTGHFFHDFFLSTGGCGMSVAGWLLTSLVMAIPVVNFIMIIVWAFQAKDKNPARRNWARSRIVIGLIIGIIMIALGGVLIGLVSKYIPQGLSL